MLARHCSLAAAPGASNVEDKDGQHKGDQDQTKLAKMREIDPQSDTRLTEALRRLAASSPQSAPPELGSGLLGEFRRHHARRRQVRRLGIASVVVCFILAASLLKVHKPP